MKKQLVGPGGIVLHLNEDPDTPAMVYDSLRRQYSSTYNCAIGEGSIDDVVDLTQQQIDWLYNQDAFVQQAYEDVGR